MLGVQGVVRSESPSHDPARNNVFKLKSRRSFPPSGPRLPALWYMPPCTQRSPHCCDEGERKKKKKKKQKKKERKKEKRRRKKKERKKEEERKKERKRKRRRRR